mmetsp:Transcript_18752/g.37345  ORF Transcript_18752/g.37345 Transcript_18752/m.37345 type:complete len:230 (-) Transcript_18752:138-827(-)
MPLPRISLRPRQRGHRRRRRRHPVRSPQAPPPPGQLRGRHLLRPPPPDQGAAALPGGGDGERGSLHRLHHQGSGQPPLEPHGAGLHPRPPGHHRPHLHGRTRRRRRRGRVGPRLSLHFLFRGRGHVRGQHPHPTGADAGRGHDQTAGRADALRGHQDPQETRRPAAQPEADAEGRRPPLCAQVGGEEAGAGGGRDGRPHGAVREQHPGRGRGDSVRGVRRGRGAAARGG